MGNQEINYYKDKKDHYIITTDPKMFHCDQDKICYYNKYRTHHGKQKRNF